MCAGIGNENFLIKIGDYSDRIRKACPVTAFTGNFAPGTPLNLKKESRVGAMLRRSSPQSLQVDAQLRPARPPLVR